MATFRPAAGIILQPRPMARGAVVVSIPRSHCMRIFVASLILLTLAASSAPARAADKKKLVLITQSVGFDHEVVKQKDGKPSIVEQTFRDLSFKTNLFDVEHS